MDRRRFLEAQACFLYVPPQAVDCIRRSMSFYSFLSDAFCCFQIGKELAFFKVDREKPFSDSTQMKFEIHIAIDEARGGSRPEVITAPGLFFFLDDDCYFVNHTLVQKMSFPKSLARKGEPPSAFISWPEVHLRCWVATNTPESVAMQKLTAAIGGMNKHLQPGLLNHEALIALKTSKRKAALINTLSARSSSSSVQHHDAGIIGDSSQAAKKGRIDDCLESTLDSWTSLLGDASRILKQQPTQDEICASFLAVPSEPLVLSYSTSSGNSSSTSSTSSSSSKVMNELSEAAKPKSTPSSSATAGISSSSSSIGGRTSGSNSYGVDMVIRDYDKVAADFVDGVFQREDAESMESFYDHELLREENVLQDCLNSLYGGDANNNQLTQEEKDQVVQRIESAMKELGDNAEKLAVLRTMPRRDFF